MNYIDKTKSPLEGNSIIDSFLNDKDTTGIDFRTDFFIIKCGKYRKNLRKVLVKEQAGYCCYCMRKLKLNPNTVTLEHIIPHGRSIDIAKFSDYVRRYPYFPNTIHKANFSMNRPRKPPYPHSISYENLVASCNGILGEPRPSCCNNHRGEAEIYPLFYLPNIAKLVTYSAFGFMSSDDIEIHKTIDKTLELNNETLKEIRKIWIKARRRQVFIKKQSQILDLFEVTEVHQLPNGIGKYCNAISPYYFNLLLEYDWFYSGSASH